jgi:hypothetical protein
MEKRDSFSLGVHATVFQAQIFATLIVDKECTARPYTDRQICIRSAGQLRRPLRHQG